MERNFETLNKEDQTKILLATKTLYNEVVEDMVETECISIEERLKPFVETIHYEYGYCSMNNIHMTNKSMGNIRNFLFGLIESVESFGTLNENTLKFVKLMLMKTDILCDMNYDNKQYNNLEAYIDEGVDSLLEALSKHLESTFRYIEKESNVTNYFHEFYKSERMDIDEYIYNADNKKLYRTRTTVLN